jgi:peptidoglycan/LPS O-acetylase OafA/YrhL
MTERDRYVDLLRTLALAAVVLGHWTMAAITVDSRGGVSVRNALDDFPALHGLTWIFQLVPLFFFVGGVANAAAWQRVVDSGGSMQRYVRRRLARLVRPALGLLVGAPAGAVALLALGVPAELAIQTLVFVLLPLWFLAVYVPLTAAAPYLLRLHARFTVRVPLLLASAVALLDLARHITGRTVFGWPNMLVFYALAQQLGFCYRDGWLLSVRRRWLVLWLAGALGGLVAATASPVWPTSMVGLPGETSNMTPPGIPLLCLLLTQVPVVLLLRPHVLPLLQRPTVVRVVDTVSQRSMSAFLWHIPLLVAVAGTLVLIGAPFPAVGSTSWWWTRPLWLAALMLLLLAALSGPHAVGRLRHSVSTMRPCSVSRGLERYSARALRSVHEPGGGSGGSSRRCEPT